MTLQRTTAVAGLLALGLVGMSAPPANTRGIVSKVNTVVHFDALSEFVPCANDGAGEEVLFEGNIHVLITSTIDAGGGVRFKYHFDPQGLGGVGQVTGDTYPPNGVTQE